MGETQRVIAAAWELARYGTIPSPLVDSPKCPGCSLVTICLPDETNCLRLTPGVEPRPALQLALFVASNGHASDAPPELEPRQLIAPRDDLRPSHPDLLLLPGRWFYGITTGLNSKNIFLPRTQFRLAEEDWFALSLARQLVVGKIRNQRTMLQRNHIEPQSDDLAALKRMAEAAEHAESIDELPGIEGNGARLYFQNFAGMIKVDDDDGQKRQFRFDFAGRNRRPPRDAVNAMLSLGYSLLVKDLTIACYAVGFDPYLGYYHQPRFGRPALALDLMEPFRPLIADSAVLAAMLFDD